MITPFDLPELVLVVAERQDPVGREPLDELGGGEVVVPAEPRTERSGAMSPTATST